MALQQPAPLRLRHTAAQTARRRRCLCCAAPLPTAMASSGERCCSLVLAFFFPPLGVRARGAACLRALRVCARCAPRAAGCLQPPQHKACSCRCPACRLQPSRPAMHSQVLLLRGCGKDFLINLLLTILLLWFGGGLRYKEIAATRCSAQQTGGGAGCTAAACAG